MAARGISSGGMAHRIHRGREAPAPMALQSRALMLIIILHSTALRSVIRSRTMRKWLLPPLLAGALHAAVIRGTVVENLTGHPLARASVVLEPVPGSPGTRMTVRTDRFGFFEFAGEPAGIYLLQASRSPFLTAQYGQKRWNSSGMPFTVTESETSFLTIRLARFGAIAGT